MSEWIQWSERAPTREDADEMGLVECHGNGARWICNWNFIPRPSSAYWRTPEPEEASQSTLTVEQIMGDLCDALKEGGCTEECDVANRVLDLIRAVVKERP